MIYDYLLLLSIPLGMLLASSSLNSTTTKDRVITVSTL